MSCPPDDDFRFLDDLYAVRSTGESDDGCLLLFDPKNARRIFYVHINWLLVHIGAFDPVHIGLLLSVKLSTAWTRSIKAAAMVVTVRPGNEGPRARRSRRS
jgi:hypothetical protein